MIIRREKQFPRIFSAVLLSFFPMEIATRGAPPAPASMANALISIKMGVNKPTPVRAELPESRGQQEKISITAEIMYNYVVGTKIV